MNDGTITLNFNEPVNAFAFDATYVSIQRTQSALIMANTYQLTSGTSTRSTDGLQLVVTVSFFDLKTIKQVNPSFTSARTTSYRGVSAQTVQDMAGNQVTPIVITSALNAISRLIPIPLVSLVFAFDFDLDASNVTLSFSETMDETSLDATKIGFHKTHAIASGLGRLSADRWIDSLQLTINLVRLESCQSWY